MKYFSLSIALTCCSLVAASAALAATPVTLYSTSYEAPDYAVGALSGQAGWINSFDIDPTVDSSFARTGSQSLRVRQLAGQPPFGLTFRTGPYTTTLPQVAVEHSIYLAGTGGWSSPSTFFSPLALGGDNGFIAQLPVRNGSHVRFGSTDFPIELETWIDLKLVLDFPTQTVSAFVNSNPIGSLPFENPATQLKQIELFHIFDNTAFDSPGPSNSFFLDDLNITAIPEPTALTLLSLPALLLTRRQR